ncbi:MAG: alanine racemase [Eubacterium sp.]|nr:alanine racemase [Candidatus Colimonas fimequi]
MYKDAMRAAWTEINLSNLDFNIKQIQQRVSPNTKITGIIKADAYGHGAIKVASVLRANGITSYGVATLAEAVRLRNAGFILEDIVILGLTPQPLIDPIIQHRLTPVVSSYANAEAISDAARHAGIIIKVNIAVDTGMGRIGFNPDDSTSIEDIKMIDKLPNIEIKGLVSQFATSDETDKTYAAVQEQRYMVFYKKLLNADVKIPVRTLANSAAIIELSSTHFEMVRPGDMLYGLYPSTEVDKRIVALRPVMSVKANIVELKNVPTGTSIGFGRNYTASKDSIIATIPIGYSDGLHRAYASKGQVIVNGVMAPIAGTIGMDMTMIDVTHVPYVRLGDEVTIMGSDGVAEITADDIAAKLNTINNEVVCDFGMRLPKVYTY